MEIREITSKLLWEDFLKNCYPRTFLQSWNWGEFLKLMGQKIWRFGIFDNDKLIATSLFTKVEAKRGRFLLVEHGPNIIFNLKEQRIAILRTFLEKLKEIAKKEKASFIRICPIWEKTKENEAVFQELKFKDAPIHLHPEISWILDLDKNEEEILSKMRKTTRYLIRQAQKINELEIKKSTQLEDLKDFYQIYQKTAKWHHFVPFSFDFLKNQLDVFKKDDQILIFLAKYKGQTIAGAIIVYWQDGGFYHHGGSLRNWPKIPASYLIQWEAIKEAKRRNCKFYSFWGIAPENRPNHPWQGLTLFKKGFGGRKEEYVKTKDYILSWKYSFNWIIETLRKFKRGYY